jgi:L-arabinose isomerase
MNNPKIGLLPMYLELYDESSPQLRTRINSFVTTICNELSKRDITVICSDVCRIKPEFEQAVKDFESEQVDAIVTLHTAYSPSLESSEVLAATDLPIIVLNTTPTYVFDHQTSVEEISFNHGIHGVQDLCNLLKRKNKKYFIETGHWQYSDVMDRVCSWAKAARLASRIKKSRVGIVGTPFKGMGDFAVPFDELKRNIGIEVIEYDLDSAASLVESVTEQEIADEMAADRERFDTSNIDEKVHYQSVKVGLALRKWITQNNLDAFTVNFLNTRKDSPVNVMPFLEIEKQMAEGMGYAGEGDVLTAALSGTLASEYKESSFTEMFCPDWKNDTIFLSHMGEMNIALASSKPELVEKSFSYTDAENPAVAYGLFKPGEVVLVNLAPDTDDNYTLILAKGEILEIDGKDMLKNSIHAWFKPECNISDFLSKFSMAGGTHHSVLCYTSELKTLKQFGHLMGWNTVTIE